MKKIFLVAYIMLASFALYAGIDSDSISIPVDCVAPVVPGMSNIALSNLILLIIGVIVRFFEKKAVIKKHKAK